MSETALKFGPEWLRVLSHGGSVSSPPPSPGIKFKLAEHRYGREEMLALFNKHQSPPDGIQNLGSLYVEEPQDPLAFIPMNEEEQRMWQRCVNSDAVLRQSGRTPVNGVGRGRGGSVDRGRGRGRGAGSYYTRGLSYDEEEPRGPREGGPPGMSLRGKPFERSQSVHEQRAWSERGGAVSGVPGVPGGPGGPEDRNGAISPRKEQGRASTENWRSRGGENDDNERWRGAGSTRNEKWVGTRGWRERENGLENDWEDGLGRGTGRGVPVSSRTSRPPWDEKDGRLRKSWDDDNLPEWATENADEKGGSFDASGAFHGPGWSDEEDPTAEGRSGGGGRYRQKLSPDKNAKVENQVTNKHESGTRESENEIQEEMKNGIDESCPKNLENEVDTNHDIHQSLNIIEERPVSVKDIKQTVEKVVPSADEQPQSVPLPNGIVSDEEETRDIQVPPEFQLIPSTVQPPKPNLHMESGPFPPREHQGEEEKLEHMRSVADDLVAKLVEEDDLRLQTGSPSQVVGQSGPMGPIPDPTVHTNHVSHTPGDDKWYYTDPQGEVQGPFSSSDMAEWYRAGYFTPTLLLKRECDDQFAQLGELTRIYGRVPFVPGPPISPLKVTEMINAQKQQAERERLELLQNYMLQKQVYQHQMAISRQQVLQKLQSMDEWNSLNPLQQQQLFMQQMMNVMPPQPPSIPNVPPSTAPPTAMPSTTQVSAPTPDPRVVPGPDMRVLPGPVPPPSKPQDPIQALVAQMQTSSAASSTPLANASDGLLTSQLTATSMAAENPLQKLIMQLQRGQQPGLGSMGNQGGPLGGSVSAGAAAAAAAAAAVGGPLENTPPDQQFDAIQSLMQQLSKMQTQTPDPMQDEHQRRQEEDQKRLEERRRLEEQKRAEEERIKMEELRIKEELKRQEEQRRNLEALRRQHEEETLRIEEEKRKMREEQARRQEEMKRIEDEKVKKEEEQKRKLLDQQQRVEAKRRQEELRRQQQQQKQLEEAKRKEEARRLEEVRRQQEEERKRKEEEEERIEREEREEEARQQAQLQEELRRMAVEEERRRMQKIEEEERQHQAKEEERRQQHMLQEHMKNLLPAWNTPPPVQAPEDAPAPSLLDIQRAQEEKERKEREVEQQMQQQREREAQRQAAEEARQKNSGLKWAAMAQANPTVPQPVKSLLEIQAEEEKELKKRQEKEAAERAAAISHMSIGAAGVWGSAVSNLSWASRASNSRSSSSIQPASQQWGGASSGNSGGIWNSSSQSTTSCSTQSVWNNDHSAIWNQAENSSAGGFWDNPEPAKSNKSASVSGRTQTKPANSSNKGVGNQGTANNRTNKKKSKNESEVVKKIFSETMSPADDFTNWCKGALNTLKVHASIDIPTFVTFLAEVESPYEVHDYIRSYLGDSKEVKEFAKQYLERRSKARNAQKECAVEDDILAPAPAVNPSSTEFQEVKTRNKKGNKKKMQKVDSSILGFSVSSNERINVGERDYAE